MIGNQKIELFAGWISDMSDNLYVTFLRLTHPKKTPLFIVVVLEGIIISDRLVQFLKTSSSMEIVRGGILKSLSEVHP
mgnify:CR=1 FL=1